MSFARLIEKTARLVFRREIAAVHTSVIAQIVSFDTALNTCSVQPCIKRIRSEDPDNLGSVPLPQIDDVPVLQRGSGKLFLSVLPSNRPST